MEILLNTYLEKNINSIDNIELSKQIIIKMNYYI